jgi:TPR repeat protein
MNAPRPTFWCHILSDQSRGKSSGDAWADWLERELSGFPIPAKLAGRRNLRGEVIPTGRLPVCVTKSHRDPAALIDEALADKLDRSLNLVVLCSPWATRSPLVDQVVRTYKMSGRSSRLLAAIIAGIPHAAGEQAGQECFPVSTRFNVDDQGELLSTPAEPIAADFRTADGGEGWTNPAAYLEALREGGVAEAEARNLARAYEERLRLMKLKIVAGVLGVSLGELTERDLAHQKQVAAQRRRQAMVRFGLIGLIGAVGITAGVLAWKSATDAQAAKAAEQQNILRAEEARRATELAKKEAESLRANQLNDEAVKLMMENTPASLAQAKLKLREAADLGAVPAQYNLARLLLDHADPEGLTWLKKAAENGSLEANNFLGICHLGRRFGLEGGTAEAGRLFQVAADKGYRPAMINLGLIAERGAPGLGGIRGAAKWFEQAGKSGDGQGWFKLYQIFATGRGELPKDLALAHRHLRQAAVQGHPEAQWTLGHLLLKGEEMPANGQEAVYWFHQLSIQRAEPRFAEMGRIQIGRMYRDGQLKKAETSGGDLAEAIRIFTELAAKGNPDAAYELGATYADIRTPVADEAAALRWYRKSAELGSPEGRLFIAQRLINGLTEQLAFHSATRWLNSREGLPTANLPYPNLFLDPRHGLATAESDRREAEQWLMTVAKSNSPLQNRAQLSLAELYLNRDLERADRFPEAIQLLQQAADRKDALAQAMLAEIYAEGREPHLKADPTKATEWRALSLANDEAAAKNYLTQREPAKALRSARGAKVAPDYIKAMVQAAQRGHPQALTELGLHHLHFDQVEDTPLPLDLPKAAQFLTPGALASDTLALMGLGLTYQKAKDLPNRFKLHLKAAMNGDQPLAQLWVGAAYEQGLGVEVDLVEADKWYQVADKSRQEGSIGGRKRVEAKMSPEQLVEARRRADAYQPLKSPAPRGTEANPPR